MSLEGRGQGCRAGQGTIQQDYCTVLYFVGWAAGTVDGEAKHCGLRETVENWAWKRWIAIYDWTPRP
jgi:hypothetical protein